MRTPRQREGYALVLCASERFEGWATLADDGVVHLDEAKLRVTDHAARGGISRRPVQPRSFSPAHWREVRWIREPKQEQSQEVEAER